MLENRNNWFQFHRTEYPQRLELRFSGLTRREMLYELLYAIDSKLIRQKNEVFLQNGLLNVGT